MGGSTDDELNPCRHRYDISMSKRTRKPRMFPGKGFVDNDTNRGFVDKGKGLEDVPDKGPDRPGEDSDDDMSWKELVTSITSSKEERPKEVKEPAGDQENRDDHGEHGRSSLGQHFTEEEKQLQIVTKQKQELVQGLKFCVKVLSLFKKTKQVGPVYKTGNIRPKKKQPLILW